MRDDEGPEWHEWSRYKIIKSLDKQLQRDIADLEIRFHRMYRNKVPYRGLPKVRKTLEGHWVLVVVTQQKPEIEYPTEIEGWLVEYAQALPAKFKSCTHLLVGGLRR